jgi:amidohydrolase
MHPSSEQLLSQLVVLRRDLHRIPELGYQEEKTAARLIRELQSNNLPYQQQGVGGGILVRLPGRDRHGPIIALQAEMDGLPVAERTGLPFASQHEGCMHACGHDGHMAMVMGAIRLFRADPPGGNLVAIFQTAEEGGVPSRLPSTPAPVASGIPGCQ